ncbi:MAG: hypothetical protein MHPSP_004939, partial [Paramarteilia canceri]
KKNKEKLGRSKCPDELSNALDAEIEFETEKYNRQTSMTSNKFSRRKSSVLHPVPLVLEKREKEKNFGDKIKRLSHKFFKYM